MKEREINKKKSSKAKVAKNLKNVAITASTKKTQNVICPGCGEKYIEPPLEDWIQCNLCKTWWHEACTSYEGGNFSCDHCQK